MFPGLTYTFTSSFEFISIFHQVINISIVQSPYNNNIKHTFSLSTEGKQIFIICDIMCLCNNASVLFVKQNKNIPEQNVMLPFLIGVLTIWQ
jgi:hypothetical protein